jgi:hypothetical protein
MNNYHINLQLIHLLNTSDNYLRSNYLLRKEVVLHKLFLNINSSFHLFEFMRLWEN